MDHEGLRDYLSSPFADVLRSELERHQGRAEEEVLRQASAKQYDPMEVRFRAGVMTGMSLIMDAISQLRKAPDASER